MSAIHTLLTVAWICAIDPAGEVRHGEVKRFPLHVDEFTTQMLVFCDWSKVQEGRLRLALRSSDGELVPLSENLTLSSRTTYQILQVKVPAFVDTPALGHSPWILEIHPDGLAPGESEPFLWYAYVATSLQMPITASPLKVAPGMPVTVQATLPQTGLTSVTARFSGQPIFAALHDDGQPPDLVADDRVYTATIVAPATAGIHKLQVRAQGPTEKASFHREPSLQIEVLP